MIPVPRRTAQQTRQLIGFAHDPTARGFMRGLDVLFLNAVFRGSSHTR